jgi:hypothetical protein
MIKLEINIPDNKAKLLKDALGYQDKIIDEEGKEIDNPQKPIDFAEEQIGNFLKQKVRRYERQEAIRNITPSDLGVIK